MRERREPRSLPLPSLEEIFGAPERSILAALDAALLLTARTLRAEYPGLDRRGRIVEDPAWEPYLPPQVPLIERILQASGELRDLIAEYRGLLDRALRTDGVGQGPDDEPCPTQPPENDPLF